ncbi:MAG: CRTAC1 family protein [Pirellulaceae bacterium]
MKNLGPESEWKFDDRGSCGVFYQESYASPATADLDNDTYLDLYFTTVYETASFKVRNQPTLFRRVGDFQFRDETEAHGLNGLPATYQAAFADFDQDGDIDLFTAGKLFENQASNSSRWLRVNLKGDGHLVNRDAIGTQVRLKLPDRVLARQVEAGTDQGNQNDLSLHFGLADFAAPYSLEILWPNGRRQNVTVEENNTTKEIVFGSNPR